MTALLAHQAAARKVSYRACELCDFGTTRNGVRHCRCARALSTAGEHPVAPERALPVAIVRAPDGSCGPDARHMRAPFLDA
ncbi:hypothetical protein [Caldimonas tepidiphila]|uniref:hypothetical protein n=1 Tax=Caldimonas tepidiphila TaxID=2315841 RepID=UPI000E5C36F0|nr:hypothetical protein [Caldimonas tepidiphila]